MSIATSSIGCLPTYHEIGLAAPIFLVFLRFLQGISTGGEYNGAFIYAFDKSKEKKGLIGGIITAGAVLGMIFASIMSYLVDIFGQDDLWRVPFIIGGILGFIGYSLRKKIEINQEIKNTKTSHEKYPYKIAFLTMMIGGISGALFYTQFIFFKGYVSSFFLMRADALSATITIFMTIYMMMLILMGKVSDKYGYLKVIRASSFALASLSIPIFYLMSYKSYTSVVIFQLFFCVVTASFVAPSHAFIKNIAPKTNQYSFIRG